MDRFTKRSMSVSGISKICCTSFESYECNLLLGNCDLCSVNDGAWERLAEYENTELSPERVAELAEADREGRLVVLPCAVGKTFYQLISVHDIFTDAIVQGILPVCLSRDIFMTREEAEAALKERKKR